MPARTSFVAWLAVSMLGGCAQPAPSPNDGADLGADVDGEGPVGCGSDNQCVDPVACTVDSCDTATGVCRNLADSTRCATGEVCDATAGCQVVPCTDNAGCDDGDVCNGAETCGAAGSCQAGTLLDCSDASTCTVDSCDPVSACQHAPIDADGDGHGDGACGGDDCDDTDPAVYPGAAEICNGIDDNCNGTVDEGFECLAGETTACVTSCLSAGTAVCGADCAFGVCAPPAEVCNGADDDCDGALDNGFPCAAGGASGCPTTCGSTGRSVCAADCTAGPCELLSESCNGIDDNCDGQIDEGCDCTPPGRIEPCPTSCGSFGMRTCDPMGRWGACTPPFEQCNGVDDDCDGAIDNGFACASGASRACTTSCGTVGIEACLAGGCFWGPCTAPAETCNGRDDNCNGFCDDGFACCAGTSRPCTTACGAPGRQSCDGACGWGACVPGAEICNGADDDCDGACDNGFTCCAGSAGSCTTTCGSGGSRSCTGSCTWGACIPPAEACNGIDDDCAGGCDNGFACCAGTNAACTTNCGSTGSRSCSGSCTWGACTPPVEACNGLDDNCDGSCDDGFACCAGTTGACTTTCGSAGSRGCSASCAWGSCTPPAEVCNGIDDDCAGGCDDGFACCAGTTGDCTTSCGSTGARSCSASCAWGSCTAPAEVCNGVDDDCAGGCDNGFACCAGTTGACTTSCGSTGSRACSASCVLGSCTPPAEVCNGSDDDCDGTCDDGFACCAGTTGACTTSCGSTGSQACSASCVLGACAPPTETCNGADDDCDGTCDDGFACCGQTTGVCTTSCGSTGSRACSASCAWGSCAPPAETCNGADDDCDGTCDDGFACCAGTTSACTTSCGSTGSRACSASCAWGSCTPPTEVCNGTDDDCDGVIDDGFACAAGSTGSCTASCESTGSRACSASCAWGSCTPPAETCNGADDDCDGTCDDGFGCCAGATLACRTSCGTAGTQACSGTCTLGSCCAAAEFCGNGCDDDCDGLTDEGCTSGGTTGWALRIGDIGNDYGYAVAADGSGNVFVTGRFEGSVDFGGGPLTSAGNTDVYVAKYSGATGAHLWSRRFGAASSDQGLGIATDASGNLFVTGSFSGSVDFGGGALASAGNTDIFVVKLSGADSSHLWSRAFGGTSNDFGNAVATTSSGDVVVTGTYIGAVSFGGGAVTSWGNEDVFVARYAGADGAYVWSRRFGSSSGDFGRGVAVDASGDVLVTGSFWFSVDFGGGALTSAGDRDIFVVKYAGADGGYRWARRFGDTSTDDGWAIGADAPGNVIIAGRFFSASINFGGAALASAGSYDVFVAKFTPTGSHLWSRRFGSTGPDEAHGVAVDASGDVAVTGRFQGTVDFGGGGLASAGNDEVFVAKYAGTDGAHRWSRRFGGFSADAGEGIAVDASGNVLVTGLVSTATVDFGTGPLLARGGADAFLVRLAP